MGVPICLLVRHGRTTANASGTLAGWTPGVDLDDVGRDQVRALAGRLAGLPLRAVVTSPLLRCRSTADLLVDGVRDHDASATLAAPEPVDDLGECRYGAWTGRSLSELSREPLWRVVQDHASAAVFPDGDDFPGESMAHMSARAVAAVRGVDARVEHEHGPDALWVAVSHGDVIKAILTDACGAHLDHLQRVVVGPASLSVVRYTTKRPFVMRVNDTGADLAGLVPPPSAPAAQDGAGGAEAGSPAADEGDDPTDRSDAAVGGGI